MSVIVLFKGYLVGEEYFVIVIFFIYGYGFFFFLNGFSRVYGFFSSIYFLVEFRVVVIC